MFKTFLYKHHWLIPTLKLILGFVCHSHTHSVFYTVCGYVFMKAMLVLLVQVGDGKTEQLVCYT